MDPETKPQSPPPEPADDTTPAESLESNSDALEKPEEGGHTTVISAVHESTTTTDPAAPPPPPQKQSLFKRLSAKLNIYLIMFILVLILALSIIVVSYFQNKKATTASDIKSQGLSQSVLQQLADSNANVGSPKQVLNVESNAVFDGQVLVRSDLAVAGNISVGGNINLGQVTVTGASDFGQVTITKNLSVDGNTGIQGAVTIGQGLQVNGSGTFTGEVSSPQITTSNLAISSDLSLTHHLIAGGVTPSRSNGPALGNGGTASVSGSDTGGSVSINTGDSPSAGCFMTINFAEKYNSTPHVIISPVGAAGGGLAYYTNRSTTSFSICDATAPPADASFGFDYIVLG